jgi:hypothetical protein
MITQMPIDDMNSYSSNSQQPVGVAGALLGMVIFVALGFIVLGAFFSGGGLNSESSLESSIAMGSIDVDAGEDFHNGKNIHVTDLQFSDGINRGSRNVKITVKTKTPMLNEQRWNMDTNAKGEIDLSPSRITTDGDETVLLFRDVPAFFERTSLGTLRYYDASYDDYSVVCLLDDWPPQWLRSLFWFM